MKKILDYIRARSISSYCLGGDYGVMSSGVRNYVRYMFILGGECCRYSLSARDVDFRGRLNAVRNMKANRVSFLMCIKWV